MEVYLTESGELRPMECGGRIAECTYRGPEMSPQPMFPDLYIENNKSSRRPVSGMGVHEEDVGYQHQSVIFPGCLLCNSCVVAGSSLVQVCRLPCGMHTYLDCVVALDWLRSREAHNHFKLL